jgi:hypothetical protein
MSLPYYDLAVSHTLLEAQTQRERVSHAVRLGWDAVALVHQAGARLADPQDRCSIRPVELEALLAAAAGVREALAAAAARGGRRHGDPHSVVQLTRVNIPADDAATAQVLPAARCNVLRQKTTRRARPPAMAAAQGSQQSASRQVLPGAPLAAAPHPPPPPPTPTHTHRPPAPAPSLAATTWWLCSPAASACSSWPAPPWTAT